MQSANHIVKMIYTVKPTFTGDEYFAGISARFTGVNCQHTVMTYMSAKLVREVGLEPTLCSFTGRAFTN